MLSYLELFSAEEDMTCCLGLKSSGWGLRLRCQSSEPWGWHRGRGWDLDSFASSFVQYLLSLQSTLGAGENVANQTRSQAITEPLGVMVGSQESGILALTPHVIGGVILGRFSLL